MKTFIIVFLVAFILSSCTRQVNLSGSVFHNNHPQRPTVIHFFDENRYVIMEGNLINHGHYQIESNHVVFDVKEFSPSLFYCKTNILYRDSTFNGQILSSKKIILDEVYGGKDYNEMYKISEKNKQKYRAVMCKQDSILIYRSKMKDKKIRIKKG